METRLTEEQIEEVQELLLETQLGNELFEIALLFHHLGFERQDIAVALYGRIGVCSSSWLGHEKYPQTQKV